MQGTIHTEPDKKKPSDPDSRRRRTTRRVCCFCFLDDFDAKLICARGEWRACGCEAPTNHAEENGLRKFLPLNGFLPKTTQQDSQRAGQGLVAKSELASDASRGWCIL